MKLPQYAIVLGAGALAAGLGWERVIIARQAAVLVALGDTAVRARQQVAERRATLERLRAQAAAHGPAPAATEDDLQGLVQRVNRLKRWVAAHSGLGTPELRYASDGDWFQAATQSAALDQDSDFAAAYRYLRSRAMFHASMLLRVALGRFSQEHAGRLPAAAEQLAPYFPDADVDPALFGRYEMLASGNATEVASGAAVIGEKVVPAADDGGASPAPGATVFGLSSRTGPEPPLLLGRLGGPGEVSFETNDGEDVFELASGLTVAKTVRAYRLANHGAAPTSYGDLLPFAVDADATRRLTRLQAIESTAKTGAAARRERPPGPAGNSASP